MPYVTEVPAPVQDPQSTPAPVRAASILMYIGGVMAVLVSAVDLRGAASVGLLVQLVGAGLFGLMYVGLGWAIGRRWAWARLTLFILCGVSAVLVVLRLILDGYVGGLISLTLPIVYVVLLTRRSARAWFAGSGQAEA
jgi:hypothetical protein